MSKSRVSLIRKGDHMPIYIPQPLKSPMNIKRFWYVRLWQFIMPKPKPEIKIDAPEGVDVVVLNEENTKDAPGLSMVLSTEQVSDPKTTSPDAPLRIKGAVDR